MTGAVTVLVPPGGSVIEETVVNAVQWLRLLVEVCSAAAVGLGVLAALGGFTVRLLRRHAAEFMTLRLTLARYLQLALELQLGADILSTAVAPGWDQIGKLGAIAVIRTALNFFLMRELHEPRPEEVTRCP